MKYYTTTQAALYLTERGLTDSDGGPVRGLTVKRWCERGQLEATRQSVGEEDDRYRAYWMIEEAALNEFVPPSQRPREGRHYRKKQ